MKKNNYLKVGIFILSAIILSCLLLLFFGLTDVFTKKVRMESFFAESVQGLTVGSPVKYKGVSVGSVSNIAIRTDDQIICVEFELHLKAFRSRENSDGFSEPEELIYYIKREINSGLRCRLDYVGITGMRYLELDYYANPSQVIAKRENMRLEIPTEPSMLKDIAKSLNSSLESIARIRFEEISDKLVKGLGDINQLLTAPELKSSLENIRSISVNLETTSTSISKVITEERLIEISSALEKNLAQIYSLTDKISKEIDKSKFPESTASFRRAADSVTAGAEVVSSRKVQATQTLDKINRTIDALRELINNLIDDPSSIISGRRQK